MWAQRDYLQEVGVSYSIKNVSLVGTDLQNEKFTIRSNLTPVHTFHYTFKLFSWMRFLMEYDYQRYIFEEVESEGDYSLGKKLFQADEMRAGLWFKTGRQSSITFFYNQKNEAYLKEADDGDLDIKYQGLYFPRIEVEQYLIGTRELGFGFRLIGETVTNGSIVENRQAFGMNLFLDGRGERSIWKFNVGGRQIDKEAEDFKLREQEMFVSFQLGLQF